MNQKRSSVAPIVIAALLPIIILVTIDIYLNSHFHNESFKRFGNAILTSYVIVGIILIGNLFFYADSRHRPMAPFVGMIFALAFVLASA